MAQAKEPNPEFTEAVVKAGGKTLTLCFQCGTCTGSCPSGRQTSFRTRKLIRQAQLGLKDSILSSPDLWACTTCFACVERCPRGVDIVDIITVLRNMAIKEGHMSEEHKKVGRYLLQNGATIPLNEKYIELRKKLGLAEKPPSTLGDQKALEDFKKILKSAGFDKIVGEC